MTKMLKRALLETLSPAEINQLYSSFDIIGDIAIIRVPNSLMEKEEIIANTILSNLKTVKTVLKQISHVSGDYRIRKLEHLLG